MTEHITTSAGRRRRPLVNRAAARRLFLEHSAEWHSDRQRMPARLMRDITAAAESVIIRAAAAGRAAPKRQRP